MMGIYGCFDVNGTCLYIGSTGITLQKLAYNHRNYWRYKDGYESEFRKNLTDIGQDWEFRWIQVPRDISRLQCEIEEGAIIRVYEPRYNVDMFPYEHSVKMGRMEQV